MQAHLLKDPGTFTSLGRNDKQLLLARHYFSSRDDPANLTLLGPGPLEPYTFAGLISGKRETDTIIGDILAVDSNEKVYGLVSSLQAGEMVSWKELAEVCKNPDRPNIDFEGDRLQRSRTSVQGYSSFTLGDINEEGIRLPEHLRNRVYYVRANVLEYLSQAKFGSLDIVGANFVFVNMKRAGEDMGEVHKCVKLALKNDGVISVDTTILDAYGIQDDLSLNPDQSYLVDLEEKYGFTVNSNLIFQAGLTSANKFLGCTAILASKSEYSASKSESRGYWEEIITKGVVNLEKEGLLVENLARLGIRETLSKGYVSIPYLNFKYGNKTNLAVKLEALVEMVKDKKVLYPTFVNDLFENLPGFYSSPH